jgi:hypothetical protein
MDVTENFATLFAAYKNLFSEKIIMMMAFKSYAIKDKPNTVYASREKIPFK